MFIVIICLTDVLKAGHIAIAMHCEYRKYCKSKTKCAASPLGRSVYNKPGVIEHPTFYVSHHEPIFLILDDGNHYP